MGYPSTANLKVPGIIDLSLEITPQFDIINLLSMRYANLKDTENSASQLDPD